MAITSPLTIRNAGIGDGVILFDLIRELAIYEKLDHTVVSTPALIEEILSNPTATAHALIAEQGGVAVGMAVYFYNFSTFLGRNGLYIEDLYVRPETRGAGIGQHLLKYLATQAVEKKCGRMEWSVLDWNEPAIAFYLRLGAEHLKEWHIYRLEGPALQALAAS
jgi:GNAT superfamily N-acetyltransferase